MPQKTPAIVCFPLNRRSGQIRRIAEHLAQLRGSDRARYMAEVVQGISRQLTSYGGPNLIVEAELEAFQAEVYKVAHMLAFRSPD